MRFNKARLTKLKLKGVSMAIEQTSTLRGNLAIHDFWSERRRHPARTCDVYEKAASASQPYRGSDRISTSRNVLTSECSLTEGRSSPGGVGSARPDSPTFGDHFGS